MAFKDIIEGDRNYQIILSKILDEEIAKNPYLKKHRESIKALLEKRIEDRRTGQRSEKRDKSH